MRGIDPSARIITNELKLIKTMNAKAHKNIV